MNRYVLVVLIFGLSGCASLTANLDRNSEGPTKEVKTINELRAGQEETIPKHRLMILPFLDNNEARPQEVRDQARDEMITELNRTGDVIALDSNELGLEIGALVRNGEYDFAAISKKASSLGISAVMEGKILDLKVKRETDEVGVFRQMKSTFECKVRVRIASARSGKELFNTIKTVTVQEGNTRVGESVEADKFFLNNPEILSTLVKESFLDFNPQIMETLGKLNWEGRIALINGDRVFLNVGKISGLNLGDILKVSEDGQDIYDPQTGNFIGRSPGRLKGTLEVISFFGQDGAIAVIHSGAGFRENDKVELY